MLDQSESMVRFGPPKILFSIVAIVGSVLAVYLLFIEAAWALFLVLLFGGWAAFHAVNLIPGMYFLELDSDGFVVCFLGQKTRRLWKYCSVFAVRSVDIGEGTLKKITYTYHGHIYGPTSWGISRRWIQSERREFEFLRGYYAVRSATMSKLVELMNKRRHEALARDGGADV